MLVALLLAVVAGVPILRLFLFFFAGNPLRQLIPLLTICRADSLGLGVLAAAAWRDTRVRAYLEAHPEAVRRAMAAVLVVSAAFCYPLLRPASWLSISAGYSVLAVLYAGLILFALLNRDHWFSAVTRGPALRSLGKVSYCVYIIHYPMLYSFHHFMLRQTPRIDSLRGAAVTALAFAATLILAALSWMYLEKPLIRRGHEYRY